MNGALPAVSALRRIAFLLERALEPSYRVRAFRRAAAVIDSLPGAELERRVKQSSLEQLPGIGAVTARVITEAHRGETPLYLRSLEAAGGRAVTEGANEIRRALRGDCHVHSDWSDGSSPIAEMAATAGQLGHDYIVLTDHSPRLKVARGLSAARLREQLEVIASVNAELAPFRILSGIEVDILEDGSLDQDPDLLGSLDLVVASIHSQLRMPHEEMTRRMVAAIADPHTNVLGHCTGRLITGRGRPESGFDPDIVFEACRMFNVAVEVNSRPERLDPPKRLLRLAIEAGCQIAIDTDAHAPGQLDWQIHGCERAAGCGAPIESVINARSADDLREWASPRH